MKQCLVSFLSDQSIPNILCIKSLRNIDDYLFVTTALMQAQGNLDWLLRVCPELSSTHILPVTETSFAGIARELQAFTSRQDSDCRYLVNLTGGNKLMSLAAYQVFSSLNSHLFYLPPLRNQIQQLFPEIIEEFRAVEYRLSPREFFQAYGMELESGQYALEDYARLSFMFGYYTAPQHQDLGPLLISFGSRCPPRGIERLTTELSEGLMLPPERLQEPYWRSFIKGAWFEQYLAHYLQQALPGLDLIVNAKLKNQESSNELDLAFSLANQLYVIEAKINAKTSELTDYIYKLDSLKQDFGIYPQAWIAVASPRFEAAWSTADVVRGRARRQRIQLLTYSDLLPETIVSSLIRLRGKY